MNDFKANRNISQNLILPVTLNACSFDKMFSIHRARLNNKSIYLKLKSVTNGIMPQMNGFIPSQSFAWLKNTVIIKDILQVSISLLLLLLFGWLVGFKGKEKHHNDFPDAIERSSKWKGRDKNEKQKIDTQDRQDRA